MDVIELARQIGRELQRDEKYIALQVATQNADEDEDLQKLIGEFNLKKIALNNEASKETRDSEKIKTLNTEAMKIYGEVMATAKMQAYQNAQKALDNYIKRIQTIITLCAQGGNPETADFDPDDENCTGNCESCGGCH